MLTSINLSSEWRHTNNYREPVGFSLKNTELEDYLSVQYIIFIILGCTGSSLLHAGFLWLRWAGPAPCGGARASRCRGFSLGSTGLSGGSSQA